MNIAVIGWGSLIWCPGSLRIKTRWRSDGPKLPIEFARISQDGRLTLVIHLGSKDQQTYWAVSELAMLDDARSNLCERENAKLKDIHYLDRDGQAAKEIPSDIKKTTQGWLAAHGDIEAVIWTGLSSNWKKKRGRDFTPNDAIKYLEELEAIKDHANPIYARARAYIMNAPPQIRTRVRRAMRERGWNDAQLPEILFEN